jgi:Ca-activated chloride channel family protein
MKLPSVVIAFCMIAVAFAQDAVKPPSDTQKADSTISVDVDLVNVVFTVFDRRGRLITDLKREQFTVVEDNRQQEITNFSRETDLPLTVALLVDTSGSIRDKLRFEQEAAIEFFYTTLRRGKDRGLVITFDSGVDLLQDYTDDPEVLANAVRRMRAGGGTALYDALYLAATEKLAGQSGRRVIILISDGDDNSSRISMTETLEAAQRNDVAIYTISTNGTTGSRSREQERGDRVLKRFSDETGGRMFSPFKLQELTQDFLNIGEELRAQYTLAYRPTNAERDGTFRRIRIDVADKRYRVGARQGYYAPRQAGVR